MNKGLWVEDIWKMGVEYFLHRNAQPNGEIRHNYYIKDHLKMQDVEDYGPNVLCSNADKWDLCRWAKKLYWGARL